MEHGSYSHSYGLLFGCSPSITPTDNGPLVVSNLVFSSCFPRLLSLLLVVSFLLSNPPQVKSTSWKRVAMVSAIQISAFSFFSFLYATLTLCDRGTNFVRGSLNWGPTLDLNAGAQTTGWWKLRRGGYNQDFHTYSLEWDEDFM